VRCRKGINPEVCHDFAQVKHVPRSRQLRLELPWKGPIVHAGRRNTEAPVSLLRRINHCPVSGEQRRAGVASKRPTTVFDPCSFGYAVTTGGCVATLLFPLSIAATSSRSSAALSPR
jgi:hypothetical protein